MGIALQPAHQRARTVVNPASYHTHSDSVCRSLIHDISVMANPFTHDTTEIMSSHGISP